MKPGYEWGNQAAAAETHQQPRHLFHYYDDNLHLAGNHFQDSQTPIASLETDQYTANPYEFSMTEGIELNLGARMYFSSSLPEGELAKLETALRRPIGNWGVVRGGGLSTVVECQAEGCKSDLAHAKHYHRRHKVCEFHSKASTVVAHGLTQRFCQQCSRFHVVAEFDQGKRSCRKRLAIHNHRRRKTTPKNPNPKHSTLTPTSTIFPTIIAKPLAAERSVSPTRMSLGCWPQEGVPVVQDVSSISCSPRSSSSSIARPVPDFRPFGQHVSVVSSWGDDKIEFIKNIRCTERSGGISST